jgi:hypothetical protein
VKLSQPELAFDPRVAKFHDSSTAAVLRLRFFAGHLPAFHLASIFSIRFCNLTNRSVGGWHTF